MRSIFSSPNNSYNVMFLALQSLTMISMADQRDVPQYIAIPWLIT